jgi:hypothetical protein
LGVLIKSAEWNSGARKDMRSMRIDVVHIANSDVYGFVWIRFWDSLRLSIEWMYWVSR